ncbi:MAG TPA: PilZ domain-containing protein [Candidatus Acidoferrum sp.]|nr:PilZ domain-containing protein [Candidatus Acidoferrum sp.]
MHVEVKGKRVEERKDLKVGVDLCSVDVRTPAHSGVTDNVSTHGARVLTSKALKSNERLTVRSMLGSYRSRARVVYCVPADGGLYAIGLQLYASAGDWVSPE